MTSTLVLGDTHGDVVHLPLACRAARDAGCDRIVQVGDWGYAWPTRPEPWDWLDDTLASFDLEMWFLDGNHDWHDILPHDASEPVPMSERVTYLPRGVRFQLGDLSCMSLGGAVSVDKQGRIAGRSWWPEETITMSQAERACDGGSVDVMFAHDCPNTAPVEDFLSKFGSLPESIEREAHNHRELVGAVIDAVQPRLFLHGHLHFRYSWHRYRTEIHGLASNKQGVDSWRVLECDRAEVPV